MGKLRDFINKLTVKYTNFKDKVKSIISTIVGKLRKFLDTCEATVVKIKNGINNGIDWLIGKIRDMKKSLDLFSDIYRIKKISKLDIKANKLDKKSIKKISKLDIKANKLDKKSQKIKSKIKYLKLEE